MYFQRIVLFKDCYFYSDFHRRFYCSDRSHVIFDVLWIAVTLPLQIILRQEVCCWKECITSRRTSNSSFSISWVAYLLDHQYVWPLSIYEICLSVLWTFAVRGTAIGSTDCCTVHSNKVFCLWTLINNVDRPSGHF